MGRDGHGATRLTQVTEGFDQSRPLNRVSSVERFVEKKHFRVRDQRSRDLGALSHPL